MTTDELNIIISADTGNAAQNISNTADELNRLGEAANNSDTDVTALVRAMSTAAEQMVSISQNIAISAGGLADFQANLTGVSSSLTGLNLRFDTLNSSIQSAYGAFDGAASSVGQLAQASDNSAAALTNITAATDGFESRMAALQASTSGTVETMDAMKAEFSNALASLKNFSTNVEDAGNEAAEASKKIQELSDKVRNVPNGSGNVGDLSKQFRALKGVIATLGIGAFIKDSQNAYNVQMQNELKLASHMQHRMNATNDEIESIKQLASEQQKLGIIGDEIQLAGAQQLTTYARQSSTLKTLIPAMNNLIAQNAGYEASTGDAISAADMLGRALGGQYTMLRRMGITFTEAQENVLKYGTETQKAAVLADAINAKVGNMNQLLAQTPTGQLKQLQNELGDFQEELAATWQPLITAYLPVLRGLLDAIKEPIKNVAAGVTIIGQAIAKGDSPAVRAIALTAAGIAVLSKLQLLIGGTSAGLLALGVVLAGIIGKMSGAQTSVSDIVSSAMASAEAATNSASDAMGDYTESVEDAQKAVSRLAGFDTITKLTGGTQGTLGSQLFNETDLAIANDINDALKDATASAGGLQDALGGLGLQNFDVSSLIQGALDISKDFWSLIFGDDSKKREILNKWNDGFVKELFGEEWSLGWQQVGQDMYNIFSGDDSVALQGWRNLNDKIKDLFGEDFTAFWNTVGGNIADIFSGNDNKILQGWRGIEQNIVKNIFGEDFVKYFEDLGANIYDALNPDKSANDSTVHITTTDGISVRSGGSGHTRALSYYEENNVQYDNRYEAENASQYRSGMPSNVPLNNITVIMTLDGEVIGQTTQSISDAQTVVSNGVY